MNFENTQLRTHRKATVATIVRISSMGPDLTLYAACHPAQPTARVENKITTASTRFPIASSAFS